MMRPDGNLSTNVHTPRVFRHIRAYSFKEAQVMLTSPEWTRVAFVRNPYTRLASAFRDKIVNNHENRRPMQLRRNASADVNASEFLELLQRNWDPHWDHKVDEHWRPQASACLFEHVDVRIPKTKTCFVLIAKNDPVIFCNTTLPYPKKNIPCSI